MQMLCGSGVSFGKTTIGFEGGIRKKEFQSREHADFSIARNWYAGAARRGERDRSKMRNFLGRSAGGGERGKGLKTFVGCLAARSRILVDRPDKRAVLVRDVTAIGRRFFALDVSKRRKGVAPLHAYFKTFHR